MRNLKVCAALSCLALFSFGATNASAADIESFDNGWFSESYYNGSEFTAGVSNINVGWNSTTGYTYRNWLAFDLASLVGQNVTSATLTFYGNNGTYASPKASETLGLFDYTGSINSLLSNQTGLGIYNDLGTGTSFGQTTISAPLTMFSITLNSAAISALNAAVNSADSRFVVGGSLLSLSPRTGDNWYSDGQLFAIFGSGSALDHAGYLSVETTPVPLPAAFPLVLSGLGALGLFGRRRKKVLAA